MNLTTATRVTRARGTVVAGLGSGKAALLGGDMSNYYGVEGPGLRIWELLAAETSIGDICGRLVEEYDVERADCERETIAFIAGLVAEALVVTL